MAEGDQKVFDIMKALTQETELPWVEDQNKTRKMHWLNKNADKNFVKRILNPKLNKGREVKNMTHFMFSAGDYVIPMVVDKGEKKLHKFEDDSEDVPEYERKTSFDKAINYAMETGEYIKTDSPKEAEWLANENYKTKEFKKGY